MGYLYWNACRGLPCTKALMQTSPDSVPERPAATPTLRVAHLAGQRPGAPGGQGADNGVQRRAVASQQRAHIRKRLVQQALHLQVGCVLDLVVVLRGAHTRGFSFN